MSTTSFDKEIYRTHPDLKRLYRELLKEDVPIIAYLILFFATPDSNDDIDITKLLTPEVWEKLSEYFYLGQITNSMDELNDAIDNILWKKNFGDLESLRKCYEGQKRLLVYQLDKELEEGKAELEAFLKNPSIDFGSMELSMLKRKAEIATLQSQIKLIQNELDCLNGLFERSKKKFFRTPRLHIDGFLGDKLNVTKAPFPPKKWK